MKMYKHSLDREEYDRIWAQIQAHWGSIAGYWYPLNDKGWPSDVVVFPLNMFHQSVPFITLHTILKQHGVVQVWELLEDYTGEEIPVESFFLDYTGVEGYWTSSEFDWMIYVSHENSIALAGTWFMDAIKRIWPQWERHTYV